MPQSRRTRPYDRNELEKPEIVERITKRLNDMPLLHADFEETTHCHILDEQILQIVKEECPLKQQVTIKRKPP